MMKPTIYRKPMRPLLIAMLTLIVVSAMLVFSLQSYLDALVMERSINNAGYVGMIYSRTQEYPMLKEIPNDILDSLKDSDSVKDVMIVSVYSARAEGLKNVADGFGNTVSLNVMLFIEGTVSRIPSISYRGTIGGIPVKSEHLHLEDITVWGGNWSRDEIHVEIIRDNNATESMMQFGDHVFLVGCGSFGSNGNVSGLYLEATEELEYLRHNDDSAIWNHPILKLKKKLDADESAVQIEEFLLETGLKESLDTINDIDDMFTVFETTDMSLLPTVVDGTTFITKGRELSVSEDTGKRVCVISEGLARENGLNVGDTIHMSFADGCYVYSSESTYYGIYGWQGGYPYEWDDLLDYSDYGEFEIVGLYSEIDRDARRMDYRHHNRNDIFIPDGILPDADVSDGVQALHMSFRVTGPDYEDFMNEFEVWLDEQGYALNMYDMGWETMRDSFYAMQDRRMIMTVCAAVMFIVAVLLSDILLSRHCRYEFALGRLLGAYSREAGKIYAFSFAFVTVPAVLASVGCSFFIYLLRMKEQASELLGGELLADGKILLFLAAWACAELLAAGVVLAYLSFRVRKKNLVMLLKQGDGQ